MSVLIKGMEKPKSCTWWDGKCPLLGDDDDCKLQDCQEEWTWQDQYKGCPLSDVSDTNVGDIISRQAAINVADYTDYTGLAIEDVKKVTDEVVKGLRQLPSAQPDIAEKLYQYKCFITDKDGLQHEVIHTGDIRRVTGWMI